MTLLSLLIVLIIVGAVLYLVKLIPIVPEAENYCASVPKCHIEESGAENVRSGGKRGYFSRRSQGEGSRSPRQETSRARE